MEKLSLRAGELAPIIEEMTKLFVEKNIKMFEGVTAMGILFASCMRIKGISLEETLRCVGHFYENVHVDENGVFSVSDDFEIVMYKTDTNGTSN